MHDRGLFDHFGSQHAEVHKEEEEEGHKGSFTHELIAGAAAYEAVKAYNEHCEKNGKPVEHARTKQLLAGFAAGALDKLIETKGLDYLDKKRAEKHAEEQLHKYADDELQIN
ncbi:hypothetical protein EC973_007447 [Apophysomyces ossiformis]|uniref:CipC protein n=1 Tax=Apophysomyces ossiformis TaxID=679940 RepID=A0A8H7EQX4_9FUNG|nr:hypothetical protein EC973_007447 [Apophysomyces ossiformis]